MVSRKSWKSAGLEYRSLKEKAAAFDRAERNARARLIQWAQAGDPAALMELRERYRLRLPLLDGTAADASTHRRSPEPSVGTAAVRERIGDGCAARD